MLRTTVGSILCTLLVSALPAQHGQGEDKHATPRQRTPPDYLSGEEARAAAVFQEVLPSVVTVLTRRTVFTEEGVREQKALGSGVLVSPECHVLTAAHVVEGADTILVRTHDGVLRRAELLFSETSADIAMIRLTPEVTDLAHARLGDSDRLVVGQVTYVVGSPYGLENSFSVGHISGFREFGRLYDGTILAEFIQTDAAINSGNSGGPVFNSRGEVIGIASQIITVSGGIELPISLDTDLVVEFRGSRDRRNHGESEGEQPCRGPAA